MTHGTGTSPDLMLWEGTGGYQPKGEFASQEAMAQGSDKLLDPFAGKAGFEGDEHDHTLTKMGWLTC